MTPGPATMTHDDPKPAGPAVRPSAPLVRDKGAMLGVLQRLHVMNDAVVFWNLDKTIKLMLRNDPVDHETMGWDLSIMCGDGDETQPVDAALDLEHDGYMDEPGLFVLDSGTLPFESGANDEAVAKVVSLVNRAYETVICPCGAYLIKDGADMCAFCQMTATPEDLRKEYCCICMDDGVAKHMATQPCCGQRLHRACLATWAAARRGDDSGGAPASCPLCRAP